MLHPLDKYMQENFPTVIMPTYGEIEPLQQNSHRFIVGGDGLYLEVKRPWLNYCQNIARQTRVAMPYGIPSAKKDVLVDVPAELVDCFLADAAAHLPNEFGAWIVYNSETQTLHYRPLETIQASGDYLEVIRPELPEHESLFCDLHSHALIPPFFSREDNKDDRHEVKVSIVAGHLDREEPLLMARLCCLGVFSEFPLSF